MKIEVSAENLIFDPYLLHYDVAQQDYVFSSDVIEDPNVLPVFGGVLFSGHKYLLLFSDKFFGRSGDDWYPGVVFPLTMTDVYTFFWGRASWLDNFSGYIKFFPNDSFFCGYLLNKFYWFLANFERKVFQIDISLGRAFKRLKHYIDRSLVPKNLRNHVLLVKYHNKNVLCLFLRCPFYNSYFEDSARNLYQLRDYIFFAPVSLIDLSYIYGQDIANVVMPLYQPRTMIYTVDGNSYISLSMDTKVSVTWSEKR